MGFRGTVDAGVRERADRHITQSRMVATSHMPTILPVGK